MLSLPIFACLLVSFGAIGTMAHDPSFLDAQAAELAATAALAEASLVDGVSGMMNSDNSTTTYQQEMFVSGLDDTTFKGQPGGTYSLVETSQVSINGIVADSADLSDSRQQFCTVSVHTPLGSRFKVTAALRKRTGKAFMAISMNDVYANHQAGSVHQSAAEDITVVMKELNHIMVHTPTSYMELVLADDGTLSFSVISVSDDASNISGALGDAIAPALDSDVEYYVDPEEHRLHDIWQGAHAGMRAPDAMASGNSALQGTNGLSIGLGLHMAAAYSV